VNRRFSRGSEWTLPSLVAHCVPITAYSSVLSLHIVHCTSYIVHRSSYIIHHISFTLTFVRTVNLGTTCAKSQTSKSSLLFSLCPFLQLCVCPPAPTSQSHFDTKTHCYRRGCGPAEITGVGSLLTHGISASRYLLSRTHHAAHTHA
jgi:hypothetical protein